MSDDYSRQLLRATVAQICQHLGWQSMHSSACDVMADVMKSYILTLAKTTAAYGCHANRTEPNLLDLSCALDHLGVNLREISEYCREVDSAPLPHHVAKFPLRKPSTHVHHGSQTAPSKRPSPVGRSTSVSSTEEEEEEGEGHIPSYLPPLPSQKEEEKVDDDNESGIHETGGKDEVMDTEESVRPPMDPSRGLPQLVRTMRFSSDLSEDGDTGSRRGSFSEGAPIRTPSEGAPIRTPSESTSIRSPFEGGISGRASDGTPLKVASEGVRDQVTAYKEAPIRTTSSEGALDGIPAAATPIEISTSDSALVGITTSVQVASAKTGTLTSLKSNVFEKEFARKLSETQPTQTTELQMQSPSAKSESPKSQGAMAYPLPSDVRKPQPPPLRLMSPSNESLAMFQAQQPPLSPLLRSPGAMRPIRQGLPILSPLGMQRMPAITPVRQVRPVMVQPLVTSPPTTSPTLNEPSMKNEQILSPVETAPISPVIAHPTAAVVSPIGAQSLFAFPYVSQQQPYTLSGFTHPPTPTLPTQTAQLGVSPQVPSTQASAKQHEVEIHKVKNDPKACLYSPPGSPQKIPLKPLHIAVEKFPIKSPPSVHRKTEIEVKELSPVPTESHPLKLAGREQSPEEATREIGRNSKPKLSPLARTDSVEEREIVNVPPVREESIEQSPEVAYSSPIQSPLQSPPVLSRTIAGKTLRTFEEASPKAEDELSSPEESEAEKRSSDDEEDELEVSESSEDSEDEKVQEKAEEPSLPKDDDNEDEEGDTEEQEYSLLMKNEQQLFIDHGETVSVVTLMPSVTLAKQEIEETEPPSSLVLSIQRRLVSSLRAKEEQEITKTAPMVTKLEVKSEPYERRPSASSLIVSSGPIVQAQSLLRGASPSLSFPEPEIPPSLVISINRRLVRHSRNIPPADNERPIKSNGAERVNYKLRLASFGQQRVKMTTPTQEKAAVPVLSPPPTRKRELDLSEVGLLGSHPKKARMEPQYSHTQPISSSSSSSSSDDDSETPSHMPSPSHSPSSSPSPSPLPPPTASWAAWQPPIRSEDEDSTPSGGSTSAAPLKLKLKISKALLQSASSDKPEKKQLRSKKPPKPPPLVPKVMVQSSKQTKGNVFVAPPPPRPKAEVTQKGGGLIIESSMPTAVPSITPKVARPGRPRSAKSGSLSISIPAPAPAAAPQSEVYICPQCNKPDDGTPMIACDNCEVWLHWYCVGIHQAPPEDKKWFCPSCVRRGKRKGKKRKHL